MPVMFIFFVCFFLLSVSLSVFLICLVILLFFFFKQKTAYEMRISDWSSDVCSSDLPEMMEAALNYPDHSHPVDTRKASLIAGVAEKTLENLRHIGGGPRYIKLGRKVMYDPRDIEAWKEARKIASTSEQVAA